jgi:DNA-binding transcriptional LysR family regulator
MPVLGSKVMLSERVQVFLAVADTLNFRKAASILKIGQSTVSRRLAELEDELAVRLLQRNTRAVVLTEAGELFRTRCMIVAADMDTAEHAVRQMAELPSGHLVLHVPTAFGRLHVAPIIQDFLTQYPDLTVELVLSDTYSDFTTDRIDAGIRIGRMDSGNLVARKIAVNRRQLCASPDYIKRRGEPVHPHDLDIHDLLEFMPLRSAGTWQFVGPGEEQLAIKVTSRLRSNNAEVLREAAVRGAGIAPLALFIAHDDLAARRLVPVLTDWQIPDTAIHVVYPDRIKLPPKTRSFVDFMVAKFRSGQPWQD